MLKFDSHLYLKNFIFIILMALFIHKSNKMIGKSCNHILLFNVF